MWRRLWIVVTIGVILGGCEEKKQELSELVNQRMALEDHLEERQTYFTSLGERKKAAETAIVSARDLGAEAQHNLLRHLAAAEYLSRAGGSRLADQIGKDKLLAARNTYGMLGALDDLTPTKQWVKVEARLNECRCEELDDEEEMPEDYYHDGCGPWEGEVMSEEECADYDSYIETAPDYECEKLIAHPGAPTSAFCTAEVYYPASGDFWEAPYSEADMETERDILRIAFELDGELYVSDYPEPSFDLYLVPEVYMIEECIYQAQVENCERDCGGDEGCEPVDCGCGGDHDYYDHYDCEGYDCPDFNPELAAAQEEVDYARERLEDAEEELAYQECLDSCMPEDEYDGEYPGDRCEEDEEDGAFYTEEGVPCVDTDDGLMPIDMVSPKATVNLRLARSPAAGVYVVREAIKHYTPYEDEEPQVVTANTLILVDYNLRLLLEEGKKELRAMIAEEGANGPLGPLEAFATIETDLSKEEAGGKILEWLDTGKKTPPLMVIRPVGGSVPAVYRFASKKSDEPATQVPAEELCELAKKHPKSEGLAEACVNAKDEQSAAEGDEADKADEEEKEDDK